MHRKNPAKSHEDPSRPQHIEGRDVVVEWRSANGDYDLVPPLVADLIQRKVDVIVVTSTPATQAAKRATSTVPIVMALVADPVGSGLVASLAHPGANVTGLSFMTTELSPKRLQLLKETIPRLTRVAVLLEPSHAVAQEGHRTPQGRGALAGDRTECGGRANTRGHWPGIFGRRKSACPGALCDRGSLVLWSSNNPSQASIEGPSASGL